MAFNNRCSVFFKAAKFVMSSAPASASTNDLKIVIVVFANKMDAFFLRIKF